jgi:hypothetical protein
MPILLKDEQITDVTGGVTAEFPFFAVLDTTFGAPFKIEIDNQRSVVCG